MRLLSSHTPALVAGVIALAIAGSAAGATCPASSAQPSEPSFGSITDMHTTLAKPPASCVDHGILTPVCRSSPKGAEYVRWQVRQATWDRNVSGYLSQLHQWQASVEGFVQCQQADIQAHQPPSS